uniref:Large ribosomal subunit protein mL54 n=1 Tax=Theileria annulata TaxID=5874 RepID=A0A3B0NII1_THEAN
MIFNINLLSNTLRLNKHYISYFNKGFYSTKIKGDKKHQKDVKTETPVSGEDGEHLFNIYASIPEDHKLLPDEAYPKWLWELDTPDKTYGELVQMFVHGKDIENSKMADYNRFCRLHNRYLIKLNNIRLQKRRKITFDTHLWDV